MSAPSSLPPFPAVLRPLVIEAETAALLVDFDGSLAPIVEDPATARALPAARAALARLVARLGRVAVVSGRPAAFLQETLDIDGLGIAGVYGLERVVGGEILVDPRVDPWLSVMAAVADAADAGLPGLLVERKGRVAVSIHWRTHPERAGEALLWAEEHAPGFGLEAPLRGRMALEFRPPVPVDKGSTAAELARGSTVAAFAGDDAGDLPAFAALGDLVRGGALRHAVSIGVASDEGPPAVRDADVVVEGPTGLAALLDQLADAVDAR